MLDMGNASVIHSSFNLRSFKELDEIQVKNENRSPNQLIKRISDSYRFRFPAFARRMDNIAGNFFDEGFEANAIHSHSRKKRIKFSGYFQDFRYLANQEEIKLTLDSPRNSYPGFENRNVLAVHIRRGDFINEKVTHGCLDASWYKRAIGYQLQAETEIVKIRIFSNDTGWINSNLRMICPETEAEIEVVQFDVGQDPAISFLDFAGCKYRVCSNSTYSLLASYIVPGKTVVPFPYNRSGNFKALEESSPSSWVRIPSIWED